MNQKIELELTAEMVDDIVVEELSHAHELITGDGFMEDEKLAAALLTVLCYYSVPSWT